jgi:hypothetical protein
MLSLKKWSVLNTIAFLAVIVVNTLAITLPINGMDTGKISDLYPNLFVPAGFTFSIWSVIYLLLLCFCVYCLKVGFGRNSRPIPFQAIETISPLFFLSCLLNISWILLWHYLLIGFSVIVMLLFLLTLINIFLSLLPYKTNLSIQEIICIRIPFSVYLGWICVATVANITAFLVHIGWEGFGIGAPAWSAAMIAVAALLGVVFLYKWKEIAYALVITWAIYGIYAKQMSASALVGYTALATIIVLFAGVVLAAYKSLQLRKARH